MRPLRVIAALLLLSLTAAGCTGNPSEIFHTSDTTAAQAQEQPQPELIPIDGLPNFALITQLGENYFGSLATEQPGEGLVWEDCLIHARTGEKTSLTYPADLPDWTLGSGSFVVLEDRFLYEWKSYTFSLGGNTLHDMKLTRTDGKTGEVTVMDELEQTSPFIYLCKLSDQEFLSYSICRVPGSEAEYATLATAVRYTADGGKTEIIRETYENDVSWTDSRGRLIERFAVDDGKIYGIGRRRIAGEYRFFLYRYSLTGEPVAELPLNGLAEIIGTEQPYDFILQGDFIVLRTFESLSTYLLRTGEREVELILSGPDGSMQYALADRRLYAISAVTDGPLCILHVLDTDGGSVETVSLPLPIREPFFVDMKALPSGDLWLTYNENGTYDPMTRQHFLLSRSVIDSRLTP
ncbi:MAG: hypothetical protein IJZ02_01725 [Clostridia bacterium]|nr:hypothetical protein [Clostridia bacterium]